MKRIYNIYLIVIILLIGCDPAGPILLKDGSKSKPIYLNGCMVEFSLITVGNSNHDLNIKINTSHNISIFVDSLKIYYRDEEMKCVIRDNNKIIDQKIISINDSSRFIGYNFFYNREKVNINDVITVFGKNYIQKGDQFFDVDTLRFVVDKIY